jgi:hypothetical protein
MTAPKAQIKNYLRNKNPLRAAWVGNYSIRTHTSALITLRAGVVKVVRRTIGVILMLKLALLAFMPSFPNRSVLVRFD